VVSAAEQRAAYRASCTHVRRGRFLGPVDGNAEEFKSVSLAKRESRTLRSQGVRVSAENGS